MTKPKIIAVLAPTKSAWGNECDKEYSAHLLTLAPDAAKACYQLNADNGIVAIANRMTHAQFDLLNTETVVCAECSATRVHSQAVEARVWKDGLFLVDEDVYQEIFS